MKKFLFLFLLGFSAMPAFAQQSQAEVDLAEHHIVFQLTSADTNVHKMLVRQLGNVLNAAPNAKVEVVCHSQGLDMLRSNLTVVYPKIKELTSKGIQFVGCENTLRERKIAKEEIIPEATFVKAGIMEIVKKQEEGWSYIRVAQ